ncbi:alpha/beta fold hydrolase [Lipingzhangella sp. LS1_29]|uniref:Alpha/beta fold hydrolase n=1 Tax=Lipingzhangella rawalii TaxID=2055835 RepID=A0ABU2HAI1_9ACTN|nr:alpha/beta fold hydrolase [Lipingzhangella rawalii]MDS1272281.1 alpha/beta fold hydrolase [Lipingzhangella rawalii]
MARLSDSHRVKDAAIWHTALQANLSYVVSGWYKLLGRQWRQGTALREIMRTRTYGHEGAFRVAERYPSPAKALVHSVMGLESLFPVVYCARGRLVRPILASLLIFHAANAYLMGLGRFLTAFASMHPHVAYTAGPKHPAAPDRDDTPVTAVALAAAGIAAWAGVRALRRRIYVLRGAKGTQWHTMPNGDVIAYRFDPGCETEPVLVFCNSLAATSEHFSWIATTVQSHRPCGVLRYDRAGYGASRQTDHTPRGLNAAVRELCDLVGATVNRDRHIVLVGHSLGGDIARRAASSLGNRVAGVVYLDPSHPGQLDRSERQRASSAGFADILTTMAWSTRLGLGVLMSRENWIEDLPSHTRERAFAEYADSRLWTAARREWASILDEYREFDSTLPPVRSPALLVTASKTADTDPEQVVLHNEIAEAHRTGGAHAETTVLHDTDHDSLMTNGTNATQVGALIMEFVRIHASGAKASFGKEAGD